jgi:ligand-binding sensor domain-containing protein
LLAVGAAWATLSASGAWAGEIARPAERPFVIKSWQTEDGLPQNTVNAIVQTRDGYLWLATQGGLARFDGVRFRTFGLRDGLRSVQVSALLEDGHGTLRVGTTGGGLSRWEQGRFVTFTEVEGLADSSVPALARGKDGAVWVGTPRGLHRWQRGNFQRFGDGEGLPAKSIRALLAGAKGNLWVSVLREGLFQGTEGGFVAVPGPPSHTNVIAYCLLEDGAGALWASAGNGVLLRPLREVNPPVQILPVQTRVPP